MLVAPWFSQNTRGHTWYLKMATAVQHRILVVALDFNDAGIGNIRTMQTNYSNGRIVGCDLTNPDSTKLAETFGAQG